MMKGTWILFDLDGTLTQSEEGIWNCAKHAVREMGLPEPDAATLRKFIGPPLYASFEKYYGMSEADALQAVVEELFAEGYETIVIEAIDENIGSNRVIQKAGFTLVGIEQRPLSRFKPQIVTLNSYRLHKVR